MKRCLSDSIIFGKKELITVKYHKEKPQICVQNLTNGRFSYIDPNVYKVVDMDNRELVDIAKTSKEGGIAYRDLGEFQFLPDYFFDIPYYIIPMQHFNKLFINLPPNPSSTEETLNGETFLKTYHQGKEKTITSVINAATHLLYRATETDGDYRIEYVFSEYNFGNRSSLIDSIFNFGDAKYKQFSRRYGFRQKSMNTVLNDETATFPIIGINQDTITISQTEGWILLNFWDFHCAPCIENLNRYGIEEKEAGKRLSENEGITIYAFNHRSDNFEKIKAIGEKTNTLDIMYSAKNMDTVISIPYLGYYYLIAPDKYIVWHSEFVGDYSELLKAKAEYEKQHYKRN